MLRRAQGEVKQHPIRKGMPVEKVRDVVISMLIVSWYKE